MLNYFSSRFFHLALCLKKDPPLLWNYWNTIQNVPELLAFLVQLDFILGWNVREEPNAYPKYSTSHISLYQLYYVSLFKSHFSCNNNGIIAISQDIVPWWMVLTRHEHQKMLFGCWLILPPPVASKSKTMGQRHSKTYTRLFLGCRKPGIKLIFWI